MHKSSRRAYKLTPDLVAAHAGGPVVCIDARSYGQSFRLHASRPDASLNRPIRSDVVGADGGVLEVLPDEGPTVTRVDIRGPLEQRAGLHDACGGWSDGHDAIAERMTMALAEGDVVMVIDSPGGAHSGLQEAVRRVLESKAENGRRIIAYADEMIGSAAYWWAATVADEIYLPEAGIIGSVGARASHSSIAGALAAEGVEPTYFAWPGPGKVAFAPELPLSDIGRQRGARDVSIAGEAFAAAVVAARPQLTREAIVALDADALTGEAAVQAGLADGVASLEDVAAYALTLSGGALESTSGTAATNRGLTMTMRAEAAAAQKKIGEPDGDEPQGTEPSQACATCGSANEHNAKFCDQCGASMAAKPLDPDEDDDQAADDKMLGEEADEDDEDDEAEAHAPDGDPAMPAPKAPPMKAPKPGMQPPPPARTAATSSLSIAAILGLRANASLPAIKSAAMDAHRVFALAAKLTGRTDSGEILGGLRAIAEDAADRNRAVQETNKLRVREERRERLELLRKLSAADIHPRGELFVDEANDVTGKITTKPNPANPIAVAPLATLRGYVEQKLAGGVPVKRRNPFEPSEAAAKRGPNTTPTDRDAELAAQLGRDPQDIAASRAALFGATSASVR